MKTSKIIFGLFILLTLATINNFAQGFTLTTTKENLVASKATIDMAGLSGNLQAIIIATPISDTTKLNPHPIGAWYYNGKWNIFNTDHATMPEGLSFKIQVFLKPDANHFMHSVTAENLTGDASFIDSPVLNNNPNARVEIFQNHAPDNRSGYLNKYPVKTEYDSAVGKWFIRNINGERMFPNSAFNVVVSSGGKYISKTAETSIAGIPKPAVMIPELVVRSVISDPQSTTTGIATLIVVARVQLDIPLINFVNAFPASCQPYVVTDPNVLETDSAIVTGQFVANPTQLNWHATVSNGTVNILICTIGAWSGKNFTNTRIKANLLVLR